MKFNLRKPCPDCPFRKDCLKGWLGEARAQSLADEVEGGKTFTCHETTEFDDDGQAMRLIDDEHCAGALILIEKLGLPHQMTQIAERLGLYRRGKLDMDAPVFDSFAEFVEHHTEEKGAAT